MKLLFIFLLACASSPLCAAYASQTDDAWGPTTNGLRMSISLNGKEIKTNAPCNLLVRYRNVSTNELFLIYEVGGTVDDHTYSFVVTSPSGADISPDLSKVQSGDSGQAHIIGPGKTLILRFNLSSFCTFDTVGTYHVIARKGEIWSRQKHDSFTVVSNPLAINVTN
jgi:hypothetical protein